MKNSSKIYCGTSYLNSWRDKNIQMYVFSKVSNNKEKNTIEVLTTFAIVLQLDLD